MVNPLDDLEQSTDLKSLVELTNSLIEKQTTLKEKEAEVKELSDDVRRLEEEVIPAKMFELGVTSFSLTDGRGVSLKDVFAGSIPTESAIERAAKRDPEEAESLKQKREDCFAWLDEHGGSPIIKRQVSIDTGKGTEAEFFEKVEEIANEYGFLTQKTEGVHPGSLNSFLKEKLKLGIDVPFETFRVFTGHKVKIK